MKVPIRDTGTASSGIKRGAPALQEQIHHHGDQHDSDQNRGHDILNAFGDRFGGIQRDHVIHILREALLSVFHQLADAFGRLHRVAARQLVHRDDGAGLAVDAPGERIILRAQFNARHIANAHGSAIGQFADDDIAELFRRGQAALRAHRIGVLLARGEQARRPPAPRD